MFFFNISWARRFVAGQVPKWQMEGVGFSPADRQINGVIVRGPDAGARVGAVPHNEFEERVRRVLDPRNKFSAASHSGV